MNSSGRDWGWIYRWHPPYLLSGFYVGSTIDLRARKSKHASKLKRAHSNPRIRQNHQFCRGIMDPADVLGKLKAVVLVPRIYLRVFEQSYIEQACSESDRDPLRGSPVNSRKAIADLAALELIDGMPDEWKRKLSTVYLDRLARAK